MDVRSSSQDLLEGRGHLPPSRKVRNLSGVTRVVRLVQAAPGDMPLNTWSRLKWPAEAHCACPSLWTALRMSRGLDMRSPGLFPAIWPCSRGRAAADFRRVLCRCQLQCLRSPGRGCACPRGDVLPPPHQVMHTVVSPLRSPTMRLLDCTGYWLFSWHRVKECWVGKSEDFGSCKAEVSPSSPILSHAMLCGTFPCPFLHTPMAVMVVGVPTATFVTLHTGCCASRCNSGCNSIHI